jgi:hypothetical protein
VIEFQNKFSCFDYLFSLIAYKKNNNLTPTAFKKRAEQLEGLG